MTSGAATLNTPAGFAAQFGVSRETVERLMLYADLVRRWQKAVNLVAPSTLPEIWHRHFSDSAQIARMIPASVQRHVDLGSGGGFPGLVLAIMRAETMPVTTVLVESDQRKCAFLREVARQTGIAVEIVAQRIETLETSANVKPVDLITARALAPLERLFALSASLSSPSTFGLFLKGKGVEQELHDARLRWQFEHHLEPSLTQEGSAIVVVRNLKASAGRA
jgi:16S rRNA (guanine527-N7)-methyltransferase